MNRVSFCVEGKNVDILIDSNYKFCFLPFLLVVVWKHFNFELFDDQMPTIEQLIKFEWILSEKAEKLICRKLKILRIGVLVLLLRVIKILVDAFFYVPNDLLT